VRIGGQEFVLLMTKPTGAAWERVDFLLGSCCSVRSNPSVAVSHSA
jgi:hypothetical protein